MGRLQYHAKYGLADALRRSPEPELKPTRADFDADVFEQEWEYSDTRAVRAIDVLAPTPQMAYVFGVVRLRVTDTGALDRVTCIKNERVERFSVERMAAVLRAETAYEREERNR